MTGELAAEVFWDGIFARLDNYNSSCGGGDWDFQAVVSEFINGIDGRRSWSFAQWCEKLEVERGTKLTDDEKSRIDNGCIGLVMFALKIDGIPPLMGGYRDFDKVKKLADDLLERIKNGEFPKGSEVILYGVQFFVDDNFAYRPGADETISLSDEMLMEIDREAKADGVTNFNFGLYDFKTNMIYDANHQEPGMRVYENTVERFRLGFGNREIYFYRLILPK